MSLLDLLTAGKVDEFNATRGQRARVDLFAADLAECQLVGADLSNANLGKADLSGADLTSSTLYKADLDGIDGTGLKLVDAIAVRARLRDAYLENAYMTGADLSNVDFAEAHLVGSSAEGARFTGARLREADATGVRWARADLSEARLHKAVLKDADLTGADLTDASGAEVVLDGARLDGSVGRGARLSGASMKGVSLAQARWRECNLSGADLTDANLQYADMTGSNLAGAVLTGAQLRGAVLCDVALDGVDLSGVDLTGVDLSGVDPLALGLSEAQIESLAASGAVLNAEAPLRFLDVQSAAANGVVALVWENVDGEEPDEEEAPVEDAPEPKRAPRSIRWALCRGGELTHGTLPLSADSVLAHAVAPVAGGFSIVVLQERPGGVHLVRYVLSAEGVLGAPVAGPLGYTPGVTPRVAVSEDGTPWMWGLARRGPTLVVHRLTEDTEDAGMVHSQLTATARGFLGRHQPVLSCKGDVVMAVGHGGAGAPTRLPAESARGRNLVGAPVGDRALVAWSVVPKARERGGIRYAWLGGRHAAEVEVLTLGGLTASMDILPHGEGAWLTWTRSAGLLGPTTVHVAHLPDGEPREVAVPGDVHEVTLTVTAHGADPCLVVTLLDEGVVVVDLKGRVVGRAAGPLA
jgi:uncharacterized protein YjbI with pentapeptide repeats